MTHGTKSRPDTSIQGFNEAHRICFREGFCHRSDVNASIRVLRRPSKANEFCNGELGDWAVLELDGHLGVQFGLAVLLDGPVVDEDLARSRFVEAGQKLDEGGL